MQTVGELRKALAECPDETPLAITTDGAAGQSCGTWEVQLDGDYGASICGL